MASSWPLETASKTKEFEKGDCARTQQTGEEGQLEGAGFVAVALLFSVELPCFVASQSCLGAGGRKTSPYSGTLRGGGVLKLIAVLRKDLSLSLSLSL